MRTALHSLFYLLLLLGSYSYAQTTELIILEEEEEEEKSFEFTGYVDAYYQANFTNSKGEGEQPLAFPTSFTEFTNTFGIGNVNLLAEKSLGKVSFVGQIGFGPRATQANGGTGNFSSTVQQLYVTYSPSETVTFTLGNFGTFVGYEVIDANANVNYSTSYLFSNGPFYHTGAKVDVALGENFGAMVGIFNDTDEKIDIVGGKHLGGQLSASAGGFSGYLNFLYGKAEELGDPDENDDDNYEFQLDLTATYEASETLMFGLNASRYSSTVDGNAVPGGFAGLALYSTIGLADDFALGLRAEYFSDIAPEGFDNNQPSALALTASGNITVGDLRIIPELRFDSGSDGRAFGPSDEDDNVAAFILAAVYSF